MQTKKVETSVELKLVAPGSAQLSDIVSEGERRAVALAFFFAELRVMSHDGGVIVDDPVSSLDDERRDGIAIRLVEEARRRQVIVFTHDLPFVADLQAQADAHDVPLVVRGMWRMGAVVGQVDEHPPFKTMNLKARVNVLKQRVQEWDTPPQPTSEDEAWRRVNDFYAHLRTAWERAVEERLFQRVVQRFQRAVKTQSLKYVEITPTLIALVEDGMTRASMFVHDEPTCGGVTLPDRTQLDADLRLLVDFESLVKSK
jgi:hypothetical protein